MIQLKAQAQQQASLQYATGDRRVADRPKQDGVVFT